MRLQADRGRTVLKGPLLLKAVGVTAFFALQLLPIIFSGTASSAVAPTITPGSVLQRIFDTTGRCKGNETTVAMGSTINTQTVCLEANITDGDGDTVRLEVEVKPVGITFDGTTKIFCSPSSDCITTGIQNTTYVATVTGLSYGSSYHWRARGVDFTGAASAWTSFGTNIDRNPLPSDPDFTAVNTPPTIGAMNQRIFDATARCKGNEFTVSEQGTINTRSICVDSTVEDVAGDTVRLEVEVKPAGATFNGTTNIFCSPSNDCVTTGVQTPFPAMVTGLSYGSSYHWRARGVDMVGLATGWTEFGTAGNTDFKTVNTPPTLGAMTQRIFDTSLRCKGNETTVDMGSTINTQAICLDADVQDAAGNGVRLEVEVKPVGVTFNGTTNLFCDDLSTCAGTSGQGQKIVTVTGLSSGTAYHWRARGVDDTGRTDGVSAWTSFGTNTDPFDPDFSIGSPSPTISAMLQRIFDTSLRCKGNETTVAVGGSIGTQTICLEADVTDAAGQSVRLEVEVKEVGTSFDGATNLFCDDLSTCAGTSAQGQKIVTVTGLANGKSYHWRARVVDFPGGTTTSWFSFGNNSDGNPPTVSAASDFTVGNTRPAISAMLQRIFDTSLRCKGNETTVVVGGSINTRVICLDADVTDPDGNAVRLEVEVKPLVKPFDTVTDIFCDDISTCTGTSTGGQKIVTIRGLSYGTEYHWQARGVDSFGADSGWSDFGNNDGAVYPSNVDFIPVNVPPTIIAGSLNQRIFDNSLRCKGNESTVVVGGSINAQTICLEATVNDTDSTQQTRLELEVQPIGTTFGNAATTTGSFDLQTGKYLPVTVSYGTKYHWQARAVDEQGAPSGWILFGANPEPSGIDFSAVNLPPTMITMLQRIFDNSLRCKGNETTVSEQGSVGTTTICLDVNVTDIDPVQTIRLEVEVKPTGSTFDGTTNIFCDDASTCAGTSAQGQKIVTISGRSYGSSYHWQARGVDNLNAATGWTEFGTAGNTDFKVVNLPPTASAVEQRVYDGACDGLGAGEVTVVEGRAIDQTSICLNATLSDPNNKLPLSGLTSNQTITLQVEVQPTTSTFSGTQNWTSTAVTESAPVARVTVGPLQSGTSYHWQYRAVDDTTRADGISAWTEFGTANNTDFTVTNHPPIIDTTTSPPLQRNLFNGTCAVGSGIVIPEGTDVLTTTICLQGNITDPDLNPVRLEVEVEPTTSTFSGTATHSEPPLGSFASGGTKIISVGGLVSGTSYHWKYRGVDDRGAATVWTEFGAANNTDFRMNNFPPTINASTVQQRVDVFADSVCLGSETTVPVGGEINETSICLEANVADVEGNSVRLEVEVQPVLTTFSNTAQFCSPDCSGFTTQGVVITVAVSGRTYGTNYHWQYRGVDNNNVVSAWTSFGGNPEANSDFKVTNTPPTLAFVEQREDLGSCPTTAGNVVAEITGTIGELSICFNATLSDVHVAETIQLQVEVQPTATTFGCPATGTCTASAKVVTSGTVNTGQIARVRAGSLSYGTSYHWQYRALDDQAIASGWTEYLTSGNTDFTVVNATPTLAFVEQREDLGSCPTTAGNVVAEITGTIGELSICFNATLSDTNTLPPQTIQLQVEVQPTGTTFGCPATGTCTASAKVVTSGTVNTGQIARVRAGSLSYGTSYHWQYRALDSTARTDGQTGWTEYLTALNTDFTVVNATPTLAFVEQREDLGSCPTTAGNVVAEITGTIGELSICFNATLSDTNTLPPQTIQLQVEVQPTGTTFGCPATGTCTASAKVVTSGTVNTGQIARVRAGSLSYGTSYHWQYRALDSTARTDGQTGWTEYLTALNTDFTVVNAAPSVTGLQQRIYDGSCDGIETTVGVGGNIDQTTICLEATVNDTNTNPPQTIQLQVEVQPTATTFGCTGTGTCAASPQVVTSGAVNSGTVARITFSALTFNTAYHWQARGLDSIGAASAWTSFGTNFDPFDTDFIPTKFPPTISALQQRVWDGVACNGDETTVRVGGDILQQTICLETKADDLDSATVRVEVEVQPVGTAFSNTATVAIDPLNSGSVGVGTVIQVGPINPLSIPGNLGPGVADSSLLALWHFDEGTGLTAADSGNVPADTGTLTGGTAWTTAGRFNRALSFNGGSNFVIVGNASAINTGTTKTVEAWVKTTSATTQVVFSTYDGGSGYQLYLQSGRPFTWSNAAVVIGGSTLDSGVSVSDGAWHHIAGVWDGTNGYIYVDGTLRNSAARTINNSTRDNQIGAACSGVASTTCSDFFNGFIDEVAIFSAPLTAPQIADHYLRGGAPLAYGTSYHWQARAVDPTGLESGWTSFATNFDPNDPDFNVVNKTPTATLAQQRVDDDGVCNGSTVPGETTVIVGGVVSVGNICFNATLSDANTLPSQTITLEVEVQPTTSTFSCTGTGACNATTVSRGTAVTDGIIGRVRVSGLADGSYHWQYRAKDSTLRDADGYSAWTSFGTDVSGASFSVGNAAPTINPATVQQRKDLGSCPTLAGSTVAEQAGATPAGTIGELSICLNATLSDVNVGDTITLQVEVQPVTSTFGGAVATSGPVSDGGVATIEVGSLSYGTSYHWRYRAVDQLNAASVWTEFGTSGNTDFKVVNALPTIQAGTANQRVYNSIPSPCNGSGAVVPENTSIFQQNICFEASLRDTSTLPPQTITLEVEVKPVSQTFTGTASSTSGLVIDGGIARVSGPSGTPGRGLAPGDLGPGVLNSNLMALWHMNNDWLDSSLNIPVNNGTAVNGATFTIASRLGAAAGSFAAATLDHVVVPDSPTLDGMTNMSVEAWVNLNSLTPTPDPQTIVAKELNYVLAVRPDGLLAGYIGDGGVAFGLSAEVTGGTPLVPGNWYHVAMTYDGTNINLYLNAILDATGTFTGGVGDTVDTVDIGYRPDLPGWPFDGRMDEVAIFNIPLNPDQITDHYTRAFDTGSLSYGTSYHWKYRAVDSAGGASDWTEFGTVNNTDFTVTNATPTINAATVRQRVYDGSCDANEATVVEQVGAAAAGAILQQTICMNATLVDVNTLPPQELQLQVEVVPMSSTFIGNVTASSLAVKSGTVAKVEVGSLSYGTSYHWKYRAVDSAGGFTGWTEFGTSGNTDFMVVNATPVISLLQRFYDGSCDGNEAGVAVGGVISTSGICLEAAVSDTNTLPTNNIRLEIEVQPVGASFTGTATHYNPSSTTYGAPGVKAIAVNGLTLGGSYHWRARALDDTARSDGISGWVSFGSNSDGSPPTTPADADFTAPCRADGIIGGNGDNVYDATGSGLGGSQTLTVTPGATSSYALSVQNEQITATTFTLSWITPTNWTVSVTDGTTETSNGSYPTGSILPGASAMYTLKATPPLSGAVTEQIIVNIVPTTSACTSGVAASLWHFDEGSGVTTSDGTTNNNTGYLSATNLLLNPSFETPTSGAPTSWTVVIGTGTSSNVDATVQHGGLQSMKLVFNGTSAAFGRQQAVAVTANAQYVLRGWLRNSLTSTNKFLQCDVQGTGIDSSGIRLDVNADWTFATETVLIPVGTTSVNVRCFADGTPAGNGWVDELSFTRVSTMPTWTTGKSGFVNALSFDGVDDYVEVPNAAPLQLTGDLTLEAWVNPTNFAATRWILSKAQPSGNFDAEYRLSITSAGLLNFSHRKSATSQDTISNGASLTPGIWQYVAAVVSGGNVTFYVNEARNGTTQAIVGEPRVATTGSLKIGVSGVTGFMSPFLGSIDEVVIWNRALTLTEIQAHAAATSGLVVNAAMAANPDSVKAVAAIAPTASQIRAPNLTVTNPPDATLSQTQLNLTWVDNSGSANSPPDPETGFKVERLDITGTGVCPGTTTGFTQIKEVLSDTVQSASTGGLVYYPDTGLTPGKKYCYQVRAFVRPVWAASDGSQDINSAYSNQAQAPNPTSGSSDTKAPAAVTDLTIKQGEQRKDSITLTWTAPPDDFDAPGVGSAASYDVRYSMLPIVDGTPGANQVDWSNLACADSTKPVDCVVQATGEPAPQLAGSPETFTVTGLATNTIYYFALKAADERGFPTGQSLMSNVAYCAGTTTSCGDNTTDGSKAGRTALRTNFNLISVPLKPASPNPMVIFEDDISGAPQLFRWNSTGFNADNGSFINYNATYTGYGLSSDAVGVWHLDGGSPTPDSSGYANNGTLVGGPSYGAGKFTSALSLNGATQYVDMGNVLNFNAQSFTVEGWIKTTQGTQWRLVQKRGTGNAGTTAGWQISGASTLNNVVVDNGLSASIYSGVTTNTGANYGVPALSTKVINDGQWHHIAMTWNSTTGQLLVYVDGALEINQTNPSLIGANLTTIRNLTIGAAWDAVGTQSQFLAGTVDEVAIWNRALTSSEIWAHATATGPLTTTTLLIQPGEGYFLIGGPYNPVIDVPVGSRALQAGDVNYGTYCGVANSFAIHLSKGWNMIGNPFTTRKDLTNSKVRIFNNDASCVTYTAAYTNPYPNNWIQNAGAIYELKGANYIYLAPALPDVYSAPQAILEPWKGYFIQAGNGSGDTNTYELIIPGP